MKPFLGMLALRKQENSCWTNVVPCWQATPCGAGLCVRAEVAFAYRDLDHSTLEITGRKGDSLAGGEDNEICYIACNIGFGVGVFPELRISHLIPKERLSVDYLVNMRESTMISFVLLEYKWNGTLLASPFSLLEVLRYVKTGLRLRRMHRKMHLADIRGTLKGRRLVAAADGRWPELMHSWRASHFAVRSGENIRINSDLPTDKQTRNVNVVST